MKSLLLFSMATLAFTSQASDETVESAGSFAGETCPQDFYSLPLFPQASMCQVFAEALPASMTYHARAGQEATRDFYQSQLGDADNEQTAKGRIVLQYQGGEQIIIISEDGQGTQVDILIKAA